MAYKQPDFHPVLPNITDDSMREIDADMKTVKRQNDLCKGIKKDTQDSDVKNKPSTDSTAVPNVSLGDKTKNSESSTGRKIIIGILIVVIIVLLLLLIYQIYKYYNEVPSLPRMEPDTDGVNGPPKSHPQNPNPTIEPKGTQHVREDGVIVIPQSTGGIPQHVKDLDNDILSQYANKGENAGEQRQTFIDSKENHSARNVGHKTMINDTRSNTGQAEEMDRISRIIDETRESDTETYTKGEDIPSREDILSQMQKDMVIDQQQSEKLERIEEENGDSIINNFLYECEDDTNSVKSEDGGCQFILTKGKNNGQCCGRKRSTDTRCPRHKGK